MAPFDEQPAKLAPTTPRNNGSNILQKRSTALGDDSDRPAKTTPTNASKKPLTVAKAPSFGRPTAKTTDTTRPTSAKGNSRAATPAQRPSSATAARVSKAATLSNVREGTTTPKPKTVVRVHGKAPNSTQKVISLRRILGHS